MYAIWPGIKDLEVRSKRRGRERENRTESIAPNYVRARERKGRTLVLGVITRAIETLSGSQFDGSISKYCYWWSCPCSCKFSSNFRALRSTGFLHTNPLRVLESKVDTLTEILSFSSKREVGE